MRPILRTPDVENNVNGVSAEEWSSRVETAAGYRLMDLYKLSDLTEGVVGVRVGNEADAFLAQPYGMFFDEVRASDLIKVKFDEKPDVGRGRPLNYASCNQVKYTLQARPEVNCVIHSHTVATSVVATTRGGLMPINQHCYVVLNQLAYVGFEVDINEDCMMKVVKALSGKNILLMQNHGFMTVGKSVAEAFYYAYNLEIACQSQVAASGMPLELPSDETANLWSSDYQTNEHHQWDGGSQWKAFLRKLDRRNPGYAA